MDVRGGPGFGEHHHGFGPGSGPGGGPFVHDLFDWAPLLPGLLMTVVVAWSLLRATGRDPVALVAGMRSVPRTHPVDQDRERWRRATDRYAATARELVTFECDPVAVLGRPALADVSQPATARFVDAFAEASALATDTYPGHSHAERFVHAAEYAERAWCAAVQATDRARAARFSPGERALVDQVVKLLTVAGGNMYEGERRTAYQHARRRLAELERRSGWALPRRAASVLEYRARGMLPPATPTPAA